jgi:hypothetical protein
MSCIRRLVFVLGAVGGLTISALTGAQAAAPPTCRRSWNFRSLDHRNSLGEWIFGGRVEASALAG